jgi:PAS domain-containing protein
MEVHRMMLEPVTGESQTGAAAIEHKCADVESRQFDERHRLALRATNDVIWDWDLKTDTVWWNDAVSTLFGYASDQVELSSRWWRENIHPEDRGRVA